MVRRTPAGTTTFSDFLELIREDQKADLLDGVIYLASPENADHNDLLRWLTVVLDLFIEDRRLGRLTINKVAYRLSDRTAPEPDLAFVAANRIDRIKPGYIDGPPDLAVEIVSPDSVDRDYEEKRRRYEAAGVLEYWIIDPLESTATFLVREGDVFVEQIAREHLYHSRVLEGFELDVRWLWQRPLPATMPIVRRLLGEE
ncbi:MAG: Uma2 family endonuclease [Planctomycetota bacterium]